METEKNFVPFDKRNYFGLRIEQWKVVIETSAKAGMVAYSAIRANEKLKER